MKHRDYWEHTERERSELTREQVEMFEAFELMRTGVLKPGDAPIEPERVEFESVSMFGVKVNFYAPSIAFETIEAAQEVVDRLKATPISFDHGLGVYVRDRDLQIETVRLVTKDLATTRLANYRKEHSLYEERKRRYDADVKRYNDALQGMWSDWHECVSRSVKMNRIKETFAEYVALAGSESLARTFFEKAFDAEDRQEADEWFSTGLYAGPMCVDEVAQ